MPWTEADVDGFKKGLSASQKKTWVEVANGALTACEKAGKEDCEASAIKQANAVVSRLGESISLREALRKALDEVDARIAESSEAAERTEMTFEEQAGELVPQEVGE